MNKSTGMLFLGVMLGLFATGCARRIDNTEHDETVLKKDVDYVAFQQACDQQQYQAAYEHASELVQRFPKNGSAWNKLGYSAEHLGRKKEAIDCYQRAVKVNPSHAKAWYNLGVARGAEGLYRDEIRCYERAVDLRPSYSQAWLNLSIARSHADDGAGSLAAYQEAVRLDPNLPHTVQIGQLNGSQNQVSPLTLTFPSSGQSAFPDAALTLAPTPPGAESVGAPENPSAITLSKPPESNRSGNLKRNGTREAEGNLIRSNEVSQLEIGQTESQPKEMEEVLNPSQDLKLRAQQLNNLGMTLESKREWESAIQNYQKALEQLYEDPMVWNNLGIAQGCSGRFGPAISSFERALKLVPDSKIVSHNLFVVHLAQAGVLNRSNKSTSQDEVAAHLEEALRLQRDGAEARFGLAELWEKQNRWEDARKHYEALVKQLPDSVAAWYGLGYACYRTDKHKPAIEALAEAVRLKPDRIEIWQLFALEQVKLQSYEDAISSLGQCIRLKPAHAEAWHQLGLVQAQLLHWKEAIAAQQKAIKLRPDWRLPQGALAAAVLGDGRIDQAKAQCEDLLNQDPTQGDVWQTFARIHEISGDWKNATAAWRRATECNPGLGLAWAGFAFALSKTDHPAESCAAYRKAMEEGYSSAELWNDLGVAYSRAGENTKALDALDKAARIQKNDPAILLNIGIIFHKLGRKQETSRTLQILQKLDSGKASELVLFIATTE